MRSLIDPWAIRIRSGAIVTNPFGIASSLKASRVALFVNPGTVPDSESKL